MLYSQNGNTAMPIVKGEDFDPDVAFYETEEKARKIAEDHPTCQAFGYEIFEMGTGS